MKITRFACKKNSVRNQGIIFSNGTVFVAYDAWRMLSKRDMPSDPARRWYMTIDDLRKDGWDVLRPTKNIYTTFKKGGKV